MINTLQIGDDFRMWDELLSLIRSSFAYMDGVIDPPSSAHRLSLTSLQQKARDEIGYVAIDAQGALAGCIFLRSEPEFLYVGKLAVAPAAQGKGVGRILLSIAEQTARDLQRPALRLETRIELAANHATFAKWGFAKTAENAHPGFSRVTSIEMQKRL